MTKKEHIERHKKLHKCLDELVADYISCVKDVSMQNTLMDLIEWSYGQTKSPNNILYDEVKSKKVQNKTGKRKKTV